MNRYNQLIDIVRNLKPISIIEIGAHRGDRAELLCRTALDQRPTRSVHYRGYDLFEAANEQTNAEEKNGKGPATLEGLRQRLLKIERLVFDLIVGNTRTTLAGKNISAEFAFIDGGHSIQTIFSDYVAVHNSNVVVFDDYYTSGVDTTKWGCNALLAMVPHEVLPIEDRFGDIGIKLAVVRNEAHAWR